MGIVGQPVAVRVPPRSWPDTQARCSHGRTSTEEGQAPMTQKAGLITMEFWLIVIRATGDLTYLIAALITLIAVLADRTNRPGKNRKQH